MFDSRTRALAVVALASSFAGMLPAATALAAGEGPTEQGQVKSEAITMTRMKPLVFLPSDAPMPGPTDLDDIDEVEPPEEHAPSRPGRPLVEDEPVEIVDLPDLDDAPDFDERRLPNPVQPAITGVPSPGDLIIGRKHKNPNLKAGSVIEPSVSNQALDVVYVGNFSADYSTDGGVTFNALKRPKGPGKTPNFGGDQTVVFDPAHSVWLWTALYKSPKSAATKTSVILISVMHNLPTVDCVYVYDPGGKANNMFVDYPQTGVGDNMFYLSTSESRSGWLRSRMMRFPTADLAACPASVAGRAVGYSPKNKRMWTPVRGAKEIMYWANFEDSASLRVWTWPESVSSASWSVETVQSTSFSNPDCRGGANNKDWLEAKGWHINEGFLRGALGRGGSGSLIATESRLQFFWNSGPDTKHTQAYVRSTVFELPSLKVITEPNISVHDKCVAYPDVHPNARGDLGVAVSWGGHANGGGTAVHSGVGIIDEFTSDYKVRKLFGIDNGTDMPPFSSTPKSNQRYGDYLSVKAHEPCRLWWIAGGYALTNGGTTPKATYVEFGRYRDKACWQRWKDVTPSVLK